MSIIDLKIIPHNGKLFKGDIPYFSTGIPIFSDNATGILSDLLKDRTEILSANTIDDSYIVINVISVIDCLD